MYVRDHNKLETNGKLIQIPEKHELAAVRLSQKKLF